MEGSVFGMEHQILCFFSLTTLSVTTRDVAVLFFLRLKLFPDLQVSALPSLSPVASRCSHATAVHAQSRLQVSAL